MLFILAGLKNLGSKGGGHASEMCLLPSHLEETLIIKYLYNSSFSFLFVKANNIKRFLESTYIKKL